jgi:subtilase family serine protease
MGSWRFFRVVCVVALCAAAVLLAPSAVHANSRWVVRNTAPDWAAPSARAAAAPNANRMVFSVWLGWRNTSTLDSRLRSLYDPSSPSYEHWLTPAQFHASYSPAATEVKQVQTWLTNQGFNVVDVPSNKLFVTAEGSTAQVEKAFSVSINLYHLDGRLVRAPNQDPTVPMALGSTVRAITGLDGAMTLTSPSHITASVKQPPPPPAGSSVGPCSRYWNQKSSTAFTNPYAPGKALPWIPCGYEPSQVMSAYGISALHRFGIDGRGQTIAITGAFFSPTISADANRFSREFRLPRLDSRNYTSVVAKGTLKYPRDDEETQSWYIEQALDVEWAHAVAPRAKLVYVGAANDAAGLDHALNQTIDEHLANIISNSWGLPEAYASKGELNSMNDMFKQAAAEGIGVYFASGDDGDLKDFIGEKSVGFPDSSPWVTSVGGTALGISRFGQRQWESGWGSTTTDWNGTRWAPKAPGDFLGGSGGGVSRVFAQPWYQQGVVPNSVAMWNGSLHRSEPDISMLADPDTPVIFTQTYVKPNGTYTQIDSWIGGTSLAAPMTAALMSLADQRAHRAHGFANPALYKLAGSWAFRDITPSDGTLAVLRNAPLANGKFVTRLRSIDRDSSLRTAPGWDDVTGLGSPNAFWLNLALR